VAALVLAGMLLGTSAAAAAGGLPAPIQAFASRWLSKVGISVPGTRGAHRTHPATPGKGDSISTLARDTDLTGLDKSALISNLASRGRSHAGDHRTGATHRRRHRHRHRIDHRRRRHGDGDGRKKGDRQRR